MTQPVAHSDDEVAVQRGVPFEIEYSYQAAQDRLPWFLLNRWPRGAAHVILKPGIYRRERFQE